MKRTHLHFNRVLPELRRHAPFTALGTLIGALLLVVLIWTQTSRSVSVTLFWTLHPLHVLLSALTTTAMFRGHGGQGVWATISVGYFGSIGIATLSDCLLPFVGESLLALPHRGLHLGFIEKWWLVNPLAFMGIAIGLVWPHTRVPHAGHVLLSTWASLFHITMALGTNVSLLDGLLIAVFLFLAVWLPCCTSDIVFPLLFAPRQPESSDRDSRHWYHITGMTGWDRAKHGLPAFGNADCVSRRRKPVASRRMLGPSIRRPRPQEDHPAGTPVSSVEQCSNDTPRKTHD